LWTSFEITTTSKQTTDRQTVGTSILIYCAKMFEKLPNYVVAANEDELSVSI